MTLLLLHSQLTVHLLSVEMIKIKNTSIRKYCSRSVYAQENNQFDFI